MAVKENEDSNVDGGRIRKKYKKKHKSTDKKMRVKKKHPCEICGKSYLGADGLKQHKLIHLGEKNWVCDICPKRFLTIHKLNEHKMSHSEKKRFQCEICGFETNKKFNLQKHINNRHFDGPIKPKGPLPDYTCDICGAVYHYPASLYVHKKRHDGIKPFKCDVCSKAFFSKSDLKRHSFIHSDEKNFICNVCGKTFSQKDLLRKHEFLHTGLKPHKCEVCGKGFATKNTLVIHVRRHTGEKPYQCENCGKSFSQASRCSSHRKKCYLKEEIIGNESMSLLNN